MLHAFFPNLPKITTFAATPLVLTPFVRKQGRRDAAHHRGTGRPPHRGAQPLRGRRRPRQGDEGRRNGLVDCAGEAAPGAPAPALRRFPHRAADGVVRLVARALHPHVDEAPRNSDGVVHTGHLPTCPFDKTTTPKQLPFDLQVGASAIFYA